MQTDPKERYGHIREVEADFLDRLLDTMKAQFGTIRFLEIGVFTANTARGIYRRGAEIGCSVEGVGVDVEQYEPNPTPADNYIFYGGDSMDQWRSIPKNKRWNLIWVDGCHCCNHSMCDFLNYSPFVETGGFCVFHDTALPTALGMDEQEPWPQTDHSYAGKPPSVLGVRDGLRKLGLLDGYRTDWKLVEEVPSDSGLGGIHLFQKVADLKAK